MNVFISVLLIIAATVAYTIYIFAKDDNNEPLDRIPPVLRWPYLVGYVISAVYITSLILQWGMIIPSFVQWLLNIIFYLLEWSIVKLIFQIISDLIYTPVIVMIVFIPCTMLEFKSHKRLTYLFQLITLACLVAIHIYDINIFDWGDAIDIVDRIIYNAAIAFAGYITYTTILEEYGREGASLERSFWLPFKRAWEIIKKIFGK